MPKKGCLRTYYVSDQRVHRRPFVGARKVRATTQPEARDLFARGVSTEMSRPAVVTYEELATKSVALPTRKRAKVDPEYAYDRQAARLAALRYDFWLNDG